ncbi:MAG: hypothetical protein ACAI25_01865 [Planctomycetota bacterium]
MSFGYVRDGDWTWLVSHDAHPVPETAWRTTFHAGPSAPAHLSAVNVYLVQQPAGATPLEQVRSTLDLAWAWQRAGATALVWPEPRMVLEGAKLARTCARRPSQLTTAELAWLLVAFTDFGVESGSRRLGTMGLTQFDQPELCCEVSDPPTEEERMAVVQFLAAAVPNVIDLGRPLEAGERIAVAGHRCVAGARTGLVQVITPFGR